MTRVSAANGDAYPMGPARALGGEGAFRFAEAWVRRPSEALARAHPRPASAAVRRRGIPSAFVIGVALAIFAVLALTVQHLRLEREMALNAGAREVDMRATLLAERLNDALSANPRAPEAEVFRSVLSAHPDERLAQSLLIDRDGRVVQYDGTQDAPDVALTALAGRATLSVADDIQGGVARILTERDGDQFAAVRGLPRTLTRVVFASPVGGHLLAWRDTVVITAFLLASTVVLMLGAAGLCGLKGRDGDEQRLLDSEGALSATVAELTQSRRSLEEQAQQLADLAER